MYKLAVLSLITGCSYEPVEAEPDAGTEVDALITVDAPLDSLIDSPTSCAGSTPFSMPIEVFPADVEQIHSANISVDGHSIVMSRDSDIFVSSRATLTSPWTAPTLVTELSSTIAERRPAFDSANHTAVFVREVAADDDDLFLSSRSSVSQPWSAPLPLGALNVAAVEDNDVFLTGDGLELWFASWRATTHSRIYRSTRPNAATAFSAPVEVMELTNVASTSMPSLSRDRLHVYVDSTRMGSLGSGDIFVASRSSVTGAFSTAVNVTAVNSSSDDRMSEPHPTSASST